ncbi:MAG: hypothetical protein PVG49_03975 [Desulfobacteraceae bacterium]
MKGEQGVFNNPRADPPVDFPSRAFLRKADGHMAKELKRNYLLLLIPAVLALAFLIGIEKLGVVSPNTLHSLGPLPFLAPIIFVLSVFFGVGLPIFYRSFFAHKVRDEKSVPENEWLKFERRLIQISLVTPYLILPAYLFQLPRFYFTGTVLMALYAAYYFYPSRKRIQFERRMFRVG